MNKKAIIISLSILVLLIVGISVALATLYSGKGKSDGNGTAVHNDFSLLHAVPSDAAAVMNFKDVKECCNRLTDTTEAFSVLVSDDESGAFPEFLSEIRRSGAIGELSEAPAAVSLHFSRIMIPLMIVDAGEVLPDTSVQVKRMLAIADSAGLHTMYVDCSKITDVAEPFTGKGIILISPSETVINSSRRHIANGLSILESDGLTGLADLLDNGDNVIFLNNTYSQKLFSLHCGRQLSKYSAFFTKMSEWSALQITSATPEHVSMTGKAYFNEDPSYYLNVFGNTSSGELLCAQMLPANTVFAASLSMDNVKKYIDAYRKYLDAASKLDKDKMAAPERWVDSLDVKEVTTASYRSRDGIRNILLVRTGKKTAMKDQAVPFRQAGYLRTVFGGLFTLDDESSVAGIGDCLVIGSKASVADYVSGSVLKNNLKDYIARAGLSSRIGKDGRFMLYYSLTEDPSGIDGLFQESLAGKLKEVIKGAGYVPAFVTVSGSSRKDFTCDITVDRVPSVVGKTPMDEKDTTVVVPKGPFQVKNSATGKMNSFYQNSSMYLCLNDENGKGIWGVPFKTSICGTVESVDYFANGKTQYLFGSGSSLWMIDRMGRFVGGFPVDLGKDILIGPHVYDFSGAHGYTALVLHKDNTIGMYDLHGRKPASWKGITSKQTIKALPELLNVKGVNYWLVRTSVQSLVFPFYGGGSLTDFSGDKMIRPDSKVTVNDNGSLTVTCLNGKEKNIRL